MYKISAYYLVCHLTMPLLFEMEGVIDIILYLEMNVIK